MTRGLTGTARTDDKPAIRFVGVSKSYRLYPTPLMRLVDQIGLNKLPLWRQKVDYQVFSALDGVNLTINKGERVGIVGRNGAGKTTLLKLITQNFLPSEGDVEVNGSVQALMQLGIGFHQEFSGYENIRSALNYNGLVGADFDKALADVIDFVELGDFLHQPMKTYSLGMNARVQFAAATAIRPDILIIDEVLGAGDAYFSAKSSTRVRKLTEHDCTLLLVSHSTPQVLQFCSRAVWLEQGKVVMDGAAKDVVGAYEVFSEQRVRASRKEADADRATATKATDASLPRFAEKRWVGDKIAAKDMVQGSEDMSARAKADEPGFTSAEFKVTLESGLEVFRWPSFEGLKFVDVQLLNEDGQPTTVLATHRNGAIRCTAVKEVDQPLRTRLFVTVFNLEALRLMWATSPLKSIEGPAGSRHVIDVGLKPVLLGGGTYVMSISLFKTEDLLHLSAEDRYDLLARCLEFKVVEFDARESPVFHHPATWDFQVGSSDSNRLGGT